MFLIWLCINGVVTRKSRFPQNIRGYDVAYFQHQTDTQVIISLKFRLPPKENLENVKLSR